MGDNAHNGRSKNDSHCPARVRRARRASRHRGVVPRSVDRPGRNFVHRRHDRRLTEKEAVMAKTLNDPLLVLARGVVMVLLALVGLVAILFALCLPLTILMPEA